MSSPTFARGLRRLAIVMALAPLTPAWAQADDSDDIAAPEGLHVQLTETPVVRPVTLVPGQLTSGTSTQTMAWVSRGRLGLGLGVERPWQAPLGMPQPLQDGAAPNDRLVLGLALRTGQRSRLLWQTEPEQTDARPPGALQLRSTNPMKSLARGVLRMELGRDTALSLKPRGRRIGVTLTSQW